MEPSASSAAVVLPVVAAAPEKVTEPKLDRGNTPDLDEGASAITSAEERCAFFNVCVVVNDAEEPFVDVSEICSVK